MICMACRESGLILLYALCNWSVRMRFSVGCVTLGKETCYFSLTLALLPQAKIRQRKGLFIVQTVAIQVTEEHTLRCHATIAMLMAAKIALRRRQASNVNVPLMTRSAKARNREIKLPPPLSWRKPEVDALADFLAYHQHWEPSYTRQRILPMLSILFLREMSSSQEDDQLLLGQYVFHSIQRIKVRYRCPLYVVKWKKVVPIISRVDEKEDKEQFDREPTETCEVSQPIAFLDETDSPEIFVDGGCHFILTDEDMGAVEAAFPDEVQRFLIEKEMKESKSKRRKSSGSDNSIGPSKSTGVQLSITEFYRSNKPLVPATPDANPSKFAKQDCSIKKGNALEDTDQTSSKPTKRRLIFS